MNSQYFSSQEVPFQELNVIWEKTGPGIAFETLTLATLGWWLFTTAAAYESTEWEGTANTELLTLSRPREKQIRMLAEQWKNVPKHIIMAGVSGLLK